MQQTLIDGRYTIGRPLGSGGMAEVYLAHDEVLDRDVALKVLRGHYAGDKEFVERFKREAQSAASLSHPNIISIYDQGRSEDGAYYMAMEYVPGGTLKDRIRRDGALAPDAAAEVALQIADALQAAHERGVIHRDIKPQNVLLSATGNVKVTDFGIARAVSSPGATDTGAVLGTAGYMSPEQAKGEPVGPASDLYSLGVVLYEMLTGNLPYEAESAIALALRHVNEPAPSPRETNPEVPKELEAVTLKLLTKDPERRYPSASALAGDLERVLLGLPSEAAGPEETERMTAPLVVSPGGRESTQRMAVRPPATAPVGSRSDRRRRGLLRGKILPALGALLLAVVLLGGVVWALTWGPDTAEPVSSASEPAAEKVEAPDAEQAPARKSPSVQRPTPVKQPAQQQTPAGQQQPEREQPGQQQPEQQQPEQEQQSGQQRQPVQPQSVQLQTPAQKNGDSTSDADSGASGGDTPAPQQVAPVQETSPADEAQEEEEERAEKEQKKEEREAEKRQEEEEERAEKKREDEEEKNDD